MSIYSDIVLADSPLGYWRCGESSGTTADNAEGTASRDGTYQNTPTLGVPGLISRDPDTAVSFTAAQSEYISTTITAMPALLSIECWVKIPFTDDSGLAGWWSSASLEAQLYATYGAIRFTFGSGNFVSYDTSNGLHTGKHHIVGTYDGTYSRLYYDGALVAGPTAYTYSGGTSNFGFLIGQYGAPWGTYWSGTIDEVAYYNYALTASQVRAHYEAGVAPPGISMSQRGVV